MTIDLAYCLESKLHSVNLLLLWSISGSISSPGNSNSLRLTLKRMFEHRNSTYQKYCLCVLIQYLYMNDVKIQTYRMEYN